MSQIILNSPEVVENESEPGVRLEINDLASEKDLEESYNVKYHQISSSRTLKYIITHRLDKCKVE